MEQRHIPHEETPGSAEALTPTSEYPILTPEAATDTVLLAEPTMFSADISLTALLQQEARSRRKQEFTSLAWGGTVIALAVWMANALPPTTSNVGWCLALLELSGLGTCIHLSLRSYRRKRSLTKALDQTQDTRHVGPLIQSLRVQNMPVQNLAKERLITLLPRLKASDAALLGDSERTILLRTLSISPHDIGYRDLRELFSQAAVRREVTLRLAILKALEQVGGTKELETVERLSRGIFTTFSNYKMPQEMQDAALECLPFLQVRANGQLAREQLLRASSASAQSGNILLRPATATGETPRDQLLRASEPQV